MNCFLISFIAKKEKVWKAVYLCIFWNVFKARKDIVLKDGFCLHKD